MYKTIDFKKYSSIQIGGVHKVKSIETIDDYSDYKIIGKANNLLISNNPPALAILSEEFDYIKQENNKLIVGAVTSSVKLLSYCKKHNIANMEFLTKLPGNIGGLTKMNAGLKNWEIFNYIYSITTKDGVILKNNIDYGYRETKIDDIIFEVSFDLEFGYNKTQQKKFLDMRNNQPKQPSAGSCFKNPNNYSAGFLIEQVGLKGYRIGDISFSSIHANFLVNLGDATFEDAITLINLAKNKVKKRFDISLELEIQII
ncbi:MAG: UDP-N-acetylmuramate dehydrogenase [Campylobacterota bacterium]|nr:UDP-N-acetylmuramate dehydrogenase [Campylobacterota bacterium]